MNQREQAETAMTAEQCARRIDNVICRKDKLEPSEDREEYLAEELEAYAAHVREAAQGEIDQLKKDLINADYDAERYRLGGLEWHDSWEEERRRVEAAERKLAELEKALQEESHTEALLKGRLEEFLRMKNERPIDPTYWDTHEENGIRAALASLRAESKEPVD